MISVKHHQTEPVPEPEDELTLNDKIVDSILAFIPTLVLLILNRIIPTIVTGEIDMLSLNH